MKRIILLIAILFMESIQVYSAEHLVLHAKIAKVGKINATKLLQVTVDGTVISTKEISNISPTVVGISGLGQSVLAVEEKGSGESVEKLWHLFKYNHSSNTWDTQALDGAIFSSTEILEASISEVIVSNEGNELALLLNNQTIIWYDLSNDLEITRYVSEGSLDALCFVFGTDKIGFYEDSRKNVSTNRSSIPNFCLIDRTGSVSRVDQQSYATNRTVWPFPAISINQSVVFAGNFYSNKHHSRQLWEWSGVAGEEPVQVNAVYTHYASSLIGNQGLLVNQKDGVWKYSKNSIGEWQTDKILGGRNEESPKWVTFVYELSPTGKYVSVPRFDFSVGVIEGRSLLKLEAPGKSIEQISAKWIAPD